MYCFRRHGGISESSLSHALRRPRDDSVMCDIFYSYSDWLNNERIFFTCGKIKTNFLIIEKSHVYCIKATFSCKFPN